MFDKGEFQTFTINPREFGMELCQKSDLVGGTPAENAAVARSILDGTERGPKRNAVLLNAGAALYIAGKAGNLSRGVSLAAELIDSGKALAALEAATAASRRV